MSSWVLGIIGGTGVNALALEDKRQEKITTQWGEPSDSLELGTLSGQDIVFVRRHGAGHWLAPNQVNYRANIAALKQAGATDILSFSACGSFREEMAPGNFVIIDQFIDRTIARAKSFFDAGCVCHVPFSDPVSHRLGDLLEAAAKAENIAYHRGGTYLAMEGPQFSTRAESKLYRQWGCDVIGMTNMPEAKLAREAELPYATLAMVTDYDSWREPPLDIDMIFETIAQNVEKAQRLIARLLADLPSPRAPDPQGIETILDEAIITAPEARDPNFASRYAPIITRFAKARGSV